MFCVDSFIGTDSGLFCVFDGHGGKETSKFFQNHFILI